jgi:membrane associated rhomboid family serine protease
MGEHIVLPLLYLFLIIGIVYTSIHYIVAVLLGCEIQDVFMRVLFPLLGTAICVFFFLRPSIKLLRYKNDKGSYLRQILALITIAVPTMIGQHYMIKATGKLCTFNSIREVDVESNCRYVEVDSFYMHKRELVLDETFQISGKHNEYEDLYINVAFPMLTEDSDTIGNSYEVWICKQYHKRVSSNNREDYKEEIFDDYRDEVDSILEEGKLTPFNYLEKCSVSEHTLDFRRMIESTGKAAQTYIMLEAKNEAFEKRLGNELCWMIGSFGIGFVLFFLSILFPPFARDSLSDLKENRVGSLSDTLHEVSFLVPQKGFVITYVLTAINLIVFLILSLAGLGFSHVRSGDLIALGANFEPLVKDGEWWRLLSSVFLHGGFFHLVSNLVGLVLAGVSLEPIIGKWKYLILYLFSGIFASLCSIYWNEGVVSVGASGAIFGLYGFLFAGSIFKIFPDRLDKTFLVLSSIVIGFNLLFLFKEGIDHAGHIGGAIAGGLMALFYWLALPFDSTHK